MKRNLPMRVAIVAPHFQELALRQANAVGAHADVLLMIDTVRLRSEYEDRPMPKSANVRISPLSFVSLLDPFRAIWRLLRYQPDTIMVHEPSGQLRALICAFIVVSLRWRSRVALTVHDPAPHEGRDADAVKRIGFLRPLIRAMAHVVVVHGEYCHQAYLRFRRIPGQTVVTTYHGVLLVDGVQSARASQEGPLKVLAFGRMEAYKGLEILCAAAEKLFERDAPVKFTIIGGGPELDRLQDRLQKLPNVTVENGYASAARLIRALADTHCVVAPYLSATQSGVVPAAFGNGRFVIGSRVGGLPDIVEDGVSGLLVTPGDVDALADAIEHAARDPDLRRRLTAGAATAARNLLDWDRLVTNMWLPVFATT